MRENHYATLVEMVFTKSAPKLQKVFQDTIFFTKKLYVFAEDFVIMD